MPMAGFFPLMTTSGKQDWDEGVAEDRDDGSPRWVFGVTEWVELG